MEIEKLNVVHLGKLGRFDNTLPLNSILRHFIQVLNETLDKFAALHDFWEHNIAKLVY